MPEQESRRRKLGFAQQRDIIIAVLLIAAAMLFQLTFHKESVEFRFDEESMTLTGPSDAGFTVEIAYQDILSASEADELEIGTNLTGVDTDACRFGTWRNEAYGEYTLCVYPAFSQYIVLETADGIVVCNYESADATRGLYKALVELLEEKGRGG